MSLASTMQPQPNSVLRRALFVAICALQLAWPAAGAGQPAAPSGDAGRPPAAPTGRFLAPAESLGFAGFARLDPDGQLERREESKRWIKRAQQKSAVAAQDDFATAVGLCPYSPEAWLLYAGSQQQLGNYAAADALIGHARDTLRYESSDRKRRHLEAESRRLGAEVAYNLGQYDRCLAEVEQALTADRDKPDLLLLQARALVATGETVRAREVLGHIEPQSPSYAAALATIGLIQMEDGELERAARTFDRAHETGMRGAIFENDRGRLLLELARPEEAARHFLAAIEQSPTFMEARNNLAVAQRRSGQPDAAEQTLLAALERNPGYAPGHFNLAELYRERSFASQPPQREAFARSAMQHYDVALQAGYRSETVLERSSGVALAIGDLAGAEAMLLKLTESPQASGRVVFLLARVKKQQGELKIAQRLYEMAAERGFQEAAVYSDLGEVLLRQSNPQDARAALRRALQINPDLVATRINLSVALQQLGEPAAADSALRRAEELAPDDPSVKEQREALRRLGHQ